MRATLPTKVSGHHREEDQRRVCFLSRGPRQNRGHDSPRVLGDLKLAVCVFMNGDEKNARLLLDEKVQMRDLERDMTANHLAD
jgi:hypothetical protein